MRLAAPCCVALVLTLGAGLVGGCSRTGLLDEDGIRCTEGNLTLTRAFPTVMLVLDRSTSMDENFGGDGYYYGPRWQSLVGALAQTLPTIDRAVELGGLLFPAITNTGICAVSAEPDLAPKLGNAEALVSLMQDHPPAGGATPTDEALKAAATALLDTRASSSARALVLATDGGPDCNEELKTRTCRCAAITSDCPAPRYCLDDKRTVEHIAEYHRQGLPTYVIGIQSTGRWDFSDVLDAMAVAGGRPQLNAPQKYYAAHSPAELGAALSAIGKLVGTCVFLTSSVPDGGGTIVLSLDGIPLGRDSWRWLKRDNGEIALHPDVCARVLAEPNASLVARITCGTGLAE